MSDLLQRTRDAFDNPVTESVSFPITSNDAFWCEEQDNIMAEQMEAMKKKADLLAAPIRAAGYPVEVEVRSPSGTLGVVGSVTVRRKPNNTRKTP